MSLDNFSIQLLSATTNPSSTITLPTMDIKTHAGYSFQFIVTGSLTFLSTLWASNDPNPQLADRVYTPLNNSIISISAPGFWYDNAPSNIACVYAQLTSFTGTGTLTVNFTSKDI